MLSIWVIKYLNQSLISKTTNTTVKFCTWVFCTLLFFLIWEHNSYLHSCMLAIFLFLKPCRRPRSHFQLSKNVLLFRDSRLIEPKYVFNLDIRLVLILTLLWRFIKSLDSPTSQPHQAEQLKFKPIQYLEFEKYNFPLLHTQIVMSTAVQAVGYFHSYLM